MAHGILKHSPAVDESQPKDKGIKWDEEVIAEHDKERGTRMKIDEPNTPYEAAVDVDALVEADMSKETKDVEENGTDQGLAAEIAELRAAMDAEGGEGGGGFGWDDEDDEDREDAGEDEKEHEKFAEARKHHYGGMGVNLKELLKKGPPPDEDEDE